MTTTDTRLLSAERLAEIRTRVAAATPGPWGCWDAYDIPCTDMVGMHRIGPSEWPTVQASPDCPVDLRARKVDAEFIAASREDMNLLLCHIDALTDLVRELAEHVAYDSAYCCGLGMSERARALTAKARAAGLLS